MPSRFSAVFYVAFLAARLGPGNIFGSTSRPWRKQSDAMRRELAMFHEVILDIDESPGRLTKRGEPLVASAHVDRAAVYGDSLAADSLYRSRSPVVSGGIRWSWDTFWWAREYSHRGTCRGAPRDAMKCHKRLPTCSHIQSVGTITPLTRLIKFPSFPYSFPTISHQKKEVKSIQIYSDLRSPPADSYGIYGSSSPLEPGSCSQTVWLPSQDLVAECCSCFLPRSV